MSKSHVTDLLSEYIEGSLPYGGSEKVRAHLAFCNSCRQALTETEHHIDVLKSTPLARVPAGLEARVLSKVQQELKSPSAPARNSGSLWPTWFTPMRGLAFAASCGIALMVVRNVPDDLGKQRQQAAPQESVQADMAVDEEALKGNDDARLEGALDSAPVQQDAETLLKKSEIAGAAASADTGAFGARAKDSLSDVAVSKEAPPATAEPEAAFARRGIAMGGAAGKSEAFAAKRDRADAAPAPWAAQNRSVAGEKKAMEVESESRRVVPIVPAPPVAPAVSEIPAVPDAPKAKLAARGALSEQAVQPISAPAPGPAGPLAGSRSAIGNPQELIISDQAAWENLWKRHNSNIQPLPDLPQVDFGTQQVVAIFAGERPSGGFRIELLDVAKTPWNGESVRVVRYRIAGPAAGTMAAQVISYPYLLSIQPRFDGQTFFQKRP